MGQIVSVVREGRVAVLTMDAGGRPTCIDIEMCEALLAAFSGLSPGQTDRVIVLRSTGRVFSAGGDLFAIERALSDPDRLLAPLIDRFHEVILAIRRLPAPVIAQVHGAAAGAGLSVVMACDFVVASRSSRLVAGYPRIGTSSDGGLTFQLAKRLGPAQAMGLFLLDEVVDAARALALGLVHRVADEDRLDIEAQAMARELVARPVQAVTEIKGLISAVADEGLALHLVREKEAFMRCAHTPDFRRLVAEFTQRQHRKHAA